MRMRTMDSIERESGKTPTLSHPAPVLVRYDRVAIALHWCIALLLLAQIVLGWWMQDIPKSPPGLRAGWFNLHKSIGMSLGLLLLVRFGWRLTHRPPDLRGLPGWQRMAAHVNHAALYVCMLVMPLTGYLGSAFSKYPVRLFGMVLPKWHAEWPAGKEYMSAAHYVIAWAFMALLIIHVAAALWHAAHRDGIISRMWPAVRTRR